ICAAPAIVLQSHQLFPGANMTGYPGLRDQIAPQQWLDKRLCYDDRYKLLTSQGPGTVLDFALKLIALLEGESQAAQVAAQLVLPGGVYDYAAAGAERRRAK
ncbi:MAG: DJ-1/PfpI family protein, partial [Enterobacteriaceae bacterium]